MREPARRLAERRIPTRLDAALFSFKVSVFRARRFATDVAHGVRRLSRGDPSAFPYLAAQARTGLWSDIRTSEAKMQRGKVHNLRVAARKLDRALLAPDALFSFWKELGPATRRRGFTSGRMLQEGCLVASTGGGLCQLSNALYNAALQAGCEIVERHAHSRIVPGSLSTVDRDATVAWNYVDLRFRSARPLLLRVTMSGEALDVRFHAASETDVAARAAPEDEARDSADDCGSCGQTTCFRHGAGTGQADGATAFVVDEFWPEFDDYIASQKRPGDVLCLPLDGKLWKRPNYAWRTDGLKLASAPLATLWRAYRSRKLAAQGAARQKELLAQADALADRLARGLSPDVTNVVVALPLLTQLWRRGALGGRRFSVLMTRAPMSALQAKLDAVAKRHPDRRTLADFRADPARVAIEDEALAAAEAIVTPHTEVAALFGERAVLLRWRAPKPPAHTPGRIVAFLGPTVARKGAYDVRAAAQALGFELRALGAPIEGAGFWNGVQRAPPAENWLEGVAVVVQPALVEDKPRPLLAALAAGVPVIATPACGLPGQPGLTLIAEDDEAALIAALQPLLQAAGASA